MNTIMIRVFDDYQCDFGFCFDWQNDSFFVLHTGNNSDLR